MRDTARAPRRSGALALVLFAVVGGCTSVGSSSAQLERGSPTTQSPEVAPTASPSTTMPTRTGRGGISPGYGIFGYHGADLDRELSAMASTGAAWLRIDVHWGDIELARGSFDWAGTDAVIRGAIAHGFRVIALPNSTPTWARPARSGDKHPPTDPADFARFLAVAVARYAPDGVHQWEIWNEENMSAFWEPGPDAAAYTRLLQAAAPAVRGADPTATVLFGGMAPGSGRAAPETFLAAAYRAGAAGSFDAVAIHPYCYPAMPNDTSTSSWNSFVRLPLVRRVMVDHGDGAKQLWATEFGAPTGSGRGASSPEDQAEALRRAYAVWAAYPWSGPLLWYAYRDDGTNGRNVGENFGLVKRDGKPKPALQAFTSAMRA